MKKSQDEAERLAGRIHAQAQTDIPAGQIRDQVPSRALPPATSSAKGGVTLSDDNPETLGPADPGAASSVSRHDHVHAHGDQSGGSLHDAATGSVAGFQSAADKAKEDLYPAITGLTPGDVLTVITSSTVGFAPPTGGSLPAGSPGDIIYYDATSTPILLPIGDPGDMLYTSTDMVPLPIWDTPPPPFGPASGDLGSSYPNPEVVGIWGIPISNLAPNDGDVYRYDSGGGLWAPDAAASGTVTSVALTVPSELSVSGSPITGSGTLALTWANATSNQVFAGPTTGSPGTPAFRALVAADIPGLPWSQITSGLPTTLAGYGITDALNSATTRTANTVYAGPGSGSAAAPTFRALVALDIPALAFSTLTGTPTTLAGYGITDAYTKTAADARYAPIAIVGTVTSVALTVPGLLFSVAGSPITTSGTFAFSLITQAANTVLAGPTTGSAANPTMRALVAADLPSTAVTPAAYGSATQSPTYTVDAQGRITTAANVTITPAYTSLTYSGLTTGQIFQATGATAAGFAALNLATAASITGILPSANGGTGVNNAGTITNATNTTITGGGTLALGGFTVTAAATGTIAMLGVANTFTAAQTVNLGGSSNQNIITALSGGSGNFAGISVGLTSATTHLAVAAGTNQFFTGTAAGDAILTNDTSGSELFLAADGGVGIRLGGGSLGFYGSAGSTKQTITGVRTGTLAQLQTVVGNLLTALANMGQLTNSTT